MGRVMTILFFMMLGAIVGTVVTLIVSALLPTRGQTLYDAEVTDGNILIGVEDASDAAVADLERALAAPQGARVKTLTR